MRKKNKTAVFVLIGLMLTGLFASCSDSDKQIKTIRDRGTLRVGVKVDVPRFGYLNPATNEMEGLEIDLACLIAQEILGDYNAVKFTNITAQTREPMLNNGEIDIVIATFTITEERKERLNFSRPYFTDELGYLVRSDASVKSPADLNGKNVGVARGSTAKTAFEEESRRLGIDMTLNEYSSYPEIKAALLGHEIDAFVGDKSILYGYLDDSCLFLNEGFNPQQYGIASTLESKSLASRINSLLETLEKNGELTAVLEKWGLSQ